jgi:hypothetical protein
MKRWILWIVRKILLIKNKKKDKTD